ncbi:MAG: hypothetical protein JWO86_9218 [Myxococcaceae bacterium]|nr:hypothetical protein [Myxococcaceae bacterium]
MRPLLLLFSFALVFAFAFASIACTEPSPDPAAPPISDANAPESSRSDDAGADTALPPAPFPAFRPAPPQVETAGGPVLKTPRIVAVVFEGDPLATEIDAFVHEMGASPEYWQRVTAEYGVGPLASTKTVIAHETPPATAAIADVQAWIKERTEGPTPLLGAFDSETMYTLFYPESTQVVLDGSGPQCQAFGGYHLDAKRPDGTSMFYVAIPRCPADALTPLEQATTAASHEWAEGAADPQPTVAPAYGRIDADHLAWGVSFSDYPTAEIGDLCALTPDDTVTPPGFTHAVQRIWSNAEARAGHDPCVPARAGAVYFNTEPVLEERIQVTPAASPPSMTKGVRVPVGTMKTIALDLYSVAPTAPWKVTVYDVRALLGEPKRLAFTTDRKTGANGDVLELTIEALASGPLGGAPFAVYSTSGATTTVSFGFVQN